MMMECEKYKEELSRLISLDFIFYGACSSRLRSLRSLILLTESIEKKYVKETYLSAGGYAEETMLIGSDKDRLLPIDDRMYYLTHAENVSNEVTSQAFLKIESCGLPGFCFLKYINHGNHRSHNELFHFVVLKEDTAYLSSEGLVEHFMKMFKVHYNPAVNGPAISTTGDWTLDHVYGLKCDSWPRKADEWIRRSRRHNWPNKELVRNHKKYPCYVIPSGNKSSKNSSIIWRYAFFEMERELMWSFNDIQIQTLLILKMLNKSYLKPIQSDQISTFALKTIILWDSENKGLSFWCQTKLLDCVDRCLCTLQDCIRERFLSHYILKERNILENKLSDINVCKLMVKKIDSIRFDIGLKILKCDVVPYKFDFSFGGVDVSRVVASGNWDLTLDKYRQRLSNMSLELSQMQHVTMNLLRLCNAVQPLKLSDDFIEKLLEIDNLEDHAKCVKDTVRVHFSTRVAYICLAFPWSYLYRGAQKFWFLTCCRDYSVSNKLHLATYYYVCGQTRKCFNITKDFSSKWKTLQYAGILKGNYRIPGESPNSKNNTNSQTREVIDNTDNRTSVSNLGNDLNYDEFVIDLYFVMDCDIKGLPEALQLIWKKGRLHNNDNIIIHPFIYAYYLLFQLYYDSGQSDGCKRALKRLQKIVPALGITEQHREFSNSLFLLGFCLYKQKEYQQAEHVLKESLRMDSRDHNVANDLLKKM